MLQWINKQRELKPILQCDSLMIYHTANRQVNHFSSYLTWLVPLGSRIWSSKEAKAAAWINSHLKKTCKYFNTVQNFFKHHRRKGECPKTTAAWRHATNLKEWVTITWLKPVNVLHSSLHKGGLTLREKGTQGPIKDNNDVPLYYP